MSGPAKDSHFDCAMDCDSGRAHDNTCRGLST